MNKQLNDEQNAAAYAPPKGILLIKALAGSGKTRVLRFRVPYILSYRDERFQRESKVLVMAFGKDVASEIKDHFNESLESKMRTRVDVRTFHSIAAVMLGKFKIHTPLASCSKFEFLKLSEIAQASKDYVYEERRVQMDIKNIRLLITLDGYATNRNMSVASSMDFLPQEAKRSLNMTPIEAQAWIKILKDFRYSNGFLTFDDLLPLANNLPANCFRALNFSDVMADELQDLNYQQRQLVFNFMRFAKSFTGVGDSCQSIFGFSGSDARIFENMLTEYPDATVLELKTNYRCSEPILHVANRILEQDIKTPMKLVGLGRLGNSPAVYTNGAIGLIQWLRMRQASGEKWKDMAILYRTKAQAPELEMCLANAKIPYVLSDLSFFEQAEIQDMLSYFKVFFDPKPDFHEWRRIINHYQGLGATFAKDIWKLSSENPTTYNFRQNPMPHCVRGEEGKSSYAKLTSDFEKLRSTLNDPVKFAMELKECLLDFWLRIYSVDMFSLKQRMECTDAFISWVASFGENVRGWDILVAVDRYEKGNRYEDPDADAVRVTTAHKSKGREWNNVALWNVGKGTFPIKTRSKEEEDEENRLLYVSATRAKQCLAIICPNESAALGSTIASYCPNTEVLASAMLKISDLGLKEEDIPELNWLKGL
jgi:DNA helicase-2/ATP-dependent DNA helicase PcrA